LCAGGGGSQAIFRRASTWNPSQNSIGNTIGCVWSPGFSRSAAFGSAPPTRPRKRGPSIRPQNYLNRSNSHHFGCVGQSEGGAGHTAT